MKNRYLIFSILSLCLTTIFLSCSKLEREKDTLELDKSSILINQEGGDNYVNVEANGAWMIQEIPEWLSVDPASGDGYGYVAVMAKANKDSVRRKASLVFTHGKLRKTVEIEQLGLTESDPFIILSESSVNWPSSAGLIRVRLTTNRPWKISEYADNWISVSPTSGEGSTEINIDIKENRNRYSRNVFLSIMGENMEKKLYINQFGLADYSLIPSMPIFRFRKMTYNSEQGAGRVFTDSMFINQKIKDKIYLGNLVGHNAQSNTRIPEFTGYTFNPVTVTVSASVPVGGEFVKNYIPSCAVQDAFAGQVAGQLHEQNDSQTVDDYAMEFYRYKDLHTLGIVNLGVKLDEVVSGISYAEKEMSRKYGLLYSFKHTSFSLNMDRPQKLIKEELKESDKAEGVSYVSSVNYGRVGLLVVESDIDSRDVRIAISNILKDKPLSSVEEALLAAADICYVYFDKEKNVQTLKGSPEAVYAYRDAVLKETDLIYPVEFKLSNYQDHSPSIITFSFRAGE